MRMASKKPLDMQAFVPSCQKHRVGICSRPSRRQSQSRYTSWLMPFRFFDRGSIPFNGNLLSRCSANDHVLGRPRFHEFSHTRFGTIERPNTGAPMGPVSVNPENVEWQKHLSAPSDHRGQNGGKSRERKKSSLA